VRTADAEVETPGRFVRRSGLTDRELAVLDRLPGASGEILVFCSSAVVPDVCVNRLPLPFA